MGDAVTRIPISFSRFNRVLMWPMLINPSRCYVELRPDTVEVRFAWAFHADIPRQSILRPRRRKDVWVTAGAHGWQGRWLVNGSRKGLVEFDVDPPGRAKVLGFPIKLRALAVSVDDPQGLIATLSGA